MSEQLGFDLGDGAAAVPRPAPPPRAPLTDQKARTRIATDLDANLLVEAGAGSGKTTELVKRMLALVRTGTAAVHEIAAVTFTRKAAGELRERFQEALEKARIDDGVLPEERARLDAALREIDRAFMGTIHSFCARLLRERPLEAGIDPAFVETTPAEATLLAERFWALHLERLANEGAPLLAQLDEVGLRPVDLRAAYHELREYPDVEFPLETVPPPDPAMVARVRAELAGILDDAAPLIPRVQPDKDWDDLQKKLRSIAYTRSYGRWDDDRVFLESLADLCKSSDWKVTQKRWASAPGSVAIRDRVNRMKAADGEARTLVDQWWAHRYPIAMRFALDAACALQRHRRETGRLDFQDLLVLAAELLRTDPAARRDLGERWRRLLVDEFQDTDPLQAEVLFLLSAEPTSAEAARAVQGDWTTAVPRPGALFVVGDPKQSIYRFRRADIALYMRVRERFGAFGDVLHLIANFRSVEPVADMVNEVFAPPDGFPWDADPMQAAFAPLVVQPRERVPESAGVYHYVVRSEDNREAISAWDADALADWIRARIGAGRKAGDFLVLTYGKKYLDRYAAAFESRNLAVQVSGAGVSVKEEVAELRLLLAALADPDDATLTVAALVGLFFGLDHEQLLEHALAGKRFDFRFARSGTGHPVEDALATLRAWSVAARTEPADVLVARIADEIGLLAHAAAGELGSVRAGALAFVLDAVRRAGLEGDTSLTGALEALEAALGEEEAEAPLEPGRADVIRLMNVHKAKGLEGKVVVLAEPTGADWAPPLDHHIERTAGGRARGWFCVMRREEKKGSGRIVTRMLARPLDWELHEARERAFEAAEDVRILYVAATRAEEELVVARHPSKAEKSPWRRFDAWLDANGRRLDIVPGEPPDRERLQLTPAELARAVSRADADREAAGTESYRFATVTGLVKGSETEAEPDDQTPPPPLRPGSSGPGGYEWGSAVHGVLEAAARGASLERLRAIGRSLLLELDRPARAGEPTELETLLATVEIVRGSPLWRRATAASHRLAEIPFALAVEDSAYLEGVVDLAFREPDGWVLVDYKTDKGDDPDFAARRVSYRAQLRRYAEAWAQLTGEPVKERVIFWTRQGQQEPVEL